eukprot:CAMPEP_0182865104 /NCGR_PEP_ID=MMETSP0034_2-20130328/7517_1 /TAXON_ID=156128 /ORGANISM="Nephroselmis pyriformis, Strain CCMP717" /LENGTH=136 /DNA_ID=CAMNT_0024997391 /DNA_START=47 /DNA_END=457 /DNA_ORIENTATION=+
MATIEYPKLPIGTCKGLKEKFTFSGFTVDGSSVKIPRGPPAQMERELEPITYKDVELTGKPHHWDTTYKGTYRSDTHWVAKDVKYTRFSPHEEHLNPPKPKPVPRTFQDTSTARQFGIDPSWPYHTMGSTVWGSGE